MKLTGHFIIGGRFRVEPGGKTCGVAAVSDRVSKPFFGGAPKDPVDGACCLAEAGFETYGKTRLGTSDRRLTSIGSLAAKRLVRLACCHKHLQQLLAAAMQEAQATVIPSRVAHHAP
jgi:hypothetical protein